MAMKMMSMAALVVVVVLASTVLQSTYAATYIVGDGTGWTFPTGNDATQFYENWTDNKNFAVGDVLVFNFNSTRHNVAEVTEASYDACTTTTPISVWTTSPTNITLNMTGDFYYICTFPGHCAAGQKVHVEVGNGPSGSPTPGSTPGGNTPSSASSLVATMALVLMSVVSVLFC